MMTHVDEQTMNNMRKRNDSSSSSTATAAASTTSNTNSNGHNSEFNKEDNKQCKYVFDYISELLDKCHERGKQIVIFLDYDGTLSPIVSRPELATMSDESRSIVSKVAQKYTTAIVSGRAKQNVRELVQLDNLYFAGSHGFDIDGPNHTRHQVATEYVPVLKQLYDELSAELQDIPGIIVENNMFSLSIHYRLVPTQELVEKVQKVVAEHVQSNSLYSKMVRITHGKMVIELRANYDWHKGKAVLHLLQCLNMTDSRHVFAIYIGDDKTDEDAFKVLEENGLGIGVLVASGHNDPRLYKSDKTNPTHARYYVEDCSQVVHLLKYIAEYNNSSLNDENSVLRD
jgi:trehalose 6-phosphate phosphatase